MLHNFNIKKQNFQNLYQNNNKNHVNGDISYVNNFSEIFNGNHLINCDHIISNNNINHNNNYNNNNNNNIGNIKEDIPLPPPPLVTEKSKTEILNKISYEKNSFLLWIVTPLAASFSVAIIIAALAGPIWLFTEEKMPNTNYNGTANYNVKDDGVYLTKYTKSSLWVLCTTLGTEFRCSTIDYFPKDEYSPDPNDSTMAIPYAITKSTPFFLLSGIALIISYILLLVAMCSQQHRLYFFTSGILFIISGLLMLIGLIMYISIFKAEIGFKLRPRSTLQPPLFTFKYGQSFFLYVVGFIVTEFVGILNVFLYIRLQHIEYGKNTVCFGYYRNSNIVESRDSNKCSSTNDRISVFGCKMHSIPCFHSLQEPRYFFEKPLPCNVHHHNLTNSLNELRSEQQPYSTLSYEFPVPSRAFNRSVSTTTDIYNNHSSDKKLYQDYNNCCNTSNNGTIGSIKNQLNKNCNSNNTLNFNVINNETAKEIKFLEFCKTVGQKEKPKDIYYIGNDCMSMNSNVYIIDPEEQCKNKYNYKDNSTRSLANFDQQNFVYYKRHDNGGSYNNVFQRPAQETHLNYFQPAPELDSKYDYQSRTLPRNFMKKNWDVMANDSMMTRRTSVNGLFLPDSNVDNYSNYNKSHEHENPDMLSTPSKWPGVKLKSGTSYSLRTQQSRLSHCGQHSDHDIFDLEKIENERRKSHASLFNEDYLDAYDYGKSTAV